MSFYRQVTRSLGIRAVLRRSPACFAQIPCRVRESGSESRFCCCSSQSHMFLGSPAPNCCPRMLRLIIFLCPCSLWVVLPLRWQIPNYPEGRTGLSKVPCSPEFYVSCGLFQTFLLLIHLQAASLTLSVWYLAGALW